MISKVVRKNNLQDYSEIRENLTYRLSKIPGERVSTVECPRRKHDGSPAKFRRTVRVVQRSSADVE